MKVEIRDLECRKGGTRVLSNITLAFEPGSIIGVIGPNGAGKSTFLRAISGLETITGGTVRIGGRTLKEMTTRERARRITYVGAEVETEFPLTAAETVAMGTYALGLRKISELETRKIHSVMEETGCLEFADRSLMELSSGERQRVQLARALLQGSKWTCLDESLSRLDLHHQARIGALLRRYLGRGYSFLFVSHDLNFTTDWADRCVLLKDGRIAAEGETKAITTETNLRKLYPDAEIVLAPHPVTGAMKAYFRG